MCVVVRRVVLACACRGVLKHGDRSEASPVPCAACILMHCIYGMYVCMSFGAGAAWAWAWVGSVYPFSSGRDKVTSSKQENPSNS